MKSKAVSTTRDKQRTASRSRLIDAAFELFASQGFAATSVAEIETAAGFAPRSGALYQYFESKGALLDAGFERHFATVDNVGRELEERPLGEVRSELAVLGHWLLQELEQERQMTHLLEREGERLTDLRERARERISERGYRVGADVIARFLPGTTPSQQDAFAVVAIGGLINFRRSAWTWGASPLGLSDQAFVDGWVEMCHAAIEALAASLG